MTSILKEGIPIMIDPLTQHILNEGYILNDKTIAVNLDDFENGKKNKLLIFGTLGSGKTTWAEFLSKNKSKMVNGKYPPRLPRVKWRGTDNLYWTFYQKYFKDKYKQTDPEVHEKLVVLIRKEVVKLLKTNDRMIIEGADFIDIYRDSPQYRKLMFNQSMILMGMSSLISGIRAGIRNMRREPSEEWDPEGWREMYWMSKMNIKDLEPTLKVMRKDVQKIPNVIIEDYKIPSLK